MHDKNESEKIMPSLKSKMSVLHRNIDGHWGNPFFEQ